MKTCGFLLVVVMGCANPAFAQLILNVNSTRDALDRSRTDRVCFTGTLLPGGVRECTLRAAIQEAHRVHPVVGAVINVPAGNYLLTMRIIAPEFEENAQRLGTWDARDGQLTGDLDIDTNLLIKGAGPGLTVIDGNDLDRVFDVFGSLASDVTFENITIRNGRSAGPGGCIYNRGIRSGVWIFTTTIEECEAPHQYGGGMFNAGDVITARAVFRNNVATLGGGLANSWEAQINDSTFDGNRAVPSTVGIGEGGGIANLYTRPSGPGSPSVRLWQSTLSNNSASVGGALANRGSAYVENSTVSGNAANRGAAVANLEPLVGSGGGLGFTLSTITANTAHLSVGAAIENDKGRTVGIHESIIAANVNGSGAIANCDGPVPTSSESIEDANTCVLSGAGDMINTDPLLGPLANNGGPTRTHALLDGSLAIDAAGTPGVNHDQRDFDRPFGLAGDIGAFERGFDFAAALIEIPLRWEDVFTSDLIEPATFSVTMSLTAAGSESKSQVSSSQITSAQIYAVKGAAANVKLTIDPTGAAAILIGMVQPPKQGQEKNPVLFYLTVQRPFHRAAHLTLTAQCGCSAAPAKPLKLPLTPYKPGKQ